MFKKEFNIKEFSRNTIVDKSNINGYSSDNSRVSGKVEIYAHYLEDPEKKIYLLRRQNNLVVYRGRNWLAQRVANSSISGYSYWQDMYLSWFAIGTGGAVAGNPLTPSAPSLTDGTLSSHGVIDSGMRYVTVNSKQYHKFDDGYPTFVEDNDIETSGLYNSRDRQLILKTITTLTTDEANDDDGISDPSSYQEINEAGLFISNSNSISSPPTQIELFARTTFPTIKKNDQVELIFNWYIFF